MTRRAGRGYARRESVTECGVPNAECGIEGLALSRPVAFPVRPQHYNSAFRTSHSAFPFMEWFNAVDATYRADLRELNELNFSRFDAKLEQRLATLDATWGGRWTQLDAKLEQRLAELRVELVKELAGVKSGLKWMLAFWAPTALAVIGTGAGVVSLLLRR